MIKDNWGNVVSLEKVSFSLLDNLDFFLELGERSKTQRFLLLLLQNLL